MNLALRQLSELNLNLKYLIKPSMFKRSCFDAWRQEEESFKIITLCRALDRHCAIAPRLITEFCGGPGTGKTQICLQLSINVQFPKEVGGSNGKALYVDTNQGFNPTRLKEITECIYERFKKTFRKEYDQPNAENSFTLDSILQNISCIYCANHVQLMATVSNLRQYAQQEPMLKLIIIDSFSFTLRSIDDVSERTRIVFEILTSLQSVAMEFEIAIVITNEVTTRVYAGNWTVCPAIGDSHTHKINQRVILSRDRESGLHVAMVDKCVLSPKVSVHFQIKNSGIRDAVL